MNMILSFCRAALLCVGLYQLAGAILCFPTGRWLKSIQSYRGTPTLSPVSYTHLQEGFELISCSITPSSKGVLVFRQTKAPQPTEVYEYEKG